MTYVESAREMEEVVTAQFPTTDVAVMVAAVSDYHVAHPSPQKMKKQNEQKSITLELVENPDILKGLAERKNSHQVVIGFAAETENVIDYALSKLEKKKVDVLIANDVSNSKIGFNADDHQVTILTKEKKSIVLPLLPKEKLAVEIWKQLLKEHML